MSLLDSAYSWLRLLVTLVIATVVGSGMWAIIVIMPDMQAEFGVDRGTVSLSYTLCMIGFAAGTLGIGRLLDRFPVVPILAAASCALAAGFAAAALAPGVWSVAAIHLLIGAGSAAGFAPLIADVSHWFLRRRGIAVAIAASGNYLSGAIWPLLLAGVQAEHGWRGTYLALAVIVPLAVLPLALVLRRRVPAEDMARADTAAALARRSAALSTPFLVTLLVIAGIACCVAMSMPQVHIVALCVDLGYGTAVGAQMLSLMLLGGVTSRLVFGMLADRLGGLRTLLIGSAAQTCALGLYLVADGQAALSLVSLVFGLSQGGIVPSYSIIVREYLPAARAGSFVGLVTSATIVGMAFGGWASGAIYDLTASYDWAFLNGIGWNLVNLAAVGAILWRGRPGPARVAAA